MLVFFNCHVPGKAAPCLLTLLLNFLTFSIFSTLSFTSAVSIGTNLRIKILKGLSIMLRWSWRHRCKGNWEDLVLPSQLGDLGECRKPRCGVWGKAPSHSHFFKILWHNEMHSGTQSAWNRQLCICGLTLTVIMHRTIGQTGYIRPLTLTLAHYSFFWGGRPSPPMKSASVVCKARVFWSSVINIWL